MENIDETGIDERGKFTLWCGNLAGVLVSGAKSC